jgi:SsrA-binding protein
MVPTRSSAASRYNARVSTNKEKPAPALIAENRKARHEYFIEDRYEAGLALMGWEVKSLRAGRVQLTESYVYIRNGEAYLFGAHFSPLNSASSHVIADPTRNRKLLLNRSEIDHLVGAVEREGYSLIPLELYWKRGRVKLRVGLAKGKKQHDKRATEKDRDWERHKGRIMRGR